LWTTGSQQPFTYQEFISNPEARLRWWRDLPQRLEQVRAQQPNDGHRALVRLEQAGILAWTITQNIDGLHRSAGTASNRLIELHGSGTTIRCTQCGTVYDAAEFLDAHRHEEEPPPCPNCGGILKSGTIAFGQSLPPNDLRLAFAVARETGVMLVVGSTLLVNPAAQVPAYAKEHGAYLAILNNGETALDDLGDVKIEAPAGLALTYLAEQILEAT
jgi:NAD-dependent deacetylase